MSEALVLEGQIPPFGCCTPYTVRKYAKLGRFGAPVKTKYGIAYRLSEIEVFFGRLWSNPPKPEDGDGSIRLTKDQIEEYTHTLVSKRDDQWFQWTMDPRLQAMWPNGPPRDGDEPKPISVTMEQANVEVL